jgi:hypothetical protein
VYGVLKVERYRGFARLAVWVASLVATWPLVFDEAYELGYGWREVWWRFRQEVALARGGSLDDVHKLLAEWKASRRV